MEVSEKIYDLFMSPIEKIKLRSIRKNLITLAKGDILEVGVGTGANFNYYKYTNLDSLYILDKSLSEKVKKYRFPEEVKIKYIEGSIEELPIQSNTMDCVVFTLVFCSVDDPFKGLREVYRVLKPGGRVLFIEHILPENNFLRDIFNKINPRWKKVTRGCHINRETLNTIKEAGFEIEKYKLFFTGSFMEGIGVKPFL